MEEVKDDEERINVGEFLIDLRKITNASLIRMKNLLPKADYKTIKNRKNARISRERRKDNYDVLMKDSNNLKV